MPPSSNKSHRRIARTLRQLTGATCAGGGAGKPPLAGLTLLDMTSVIAGPYCAGQLADYGMEVIKIENGDGVGDSYRKAGSQIRLDSKERYGASFASFNRGKRSIALNAATPEGQAVVKKLAESADVFLQNMRPGVAEKLGLGYEDLKTVNPNLIYCSISGFGPTGPLISEPVYDPIIQSRSGFVATQARVAEGKTTLINTLVHDKTTAMVGVQAIMAALYARDQQGAGGQHVTLAMLDTGIQFLWGEVHSNNHYFVDAGSDARVTDLPGLIAEGFGVHTASDGHVAMLQMERPVKFERFAKKFDPAMLEDERFNNPRGRMIEHNGAFKAAVDAALAAHTVADITAAFKEADIPGGPVLSIADSYKDPQAVHNKITVERFNEKIGAKVRDARLAPRFSGTPVRLSDPAPLYGEHTAEVMRELGFTDAQVGKMVEDGVLRLVQE